MSKRVSFLLATMNRGEYLRKTLEIIRELIKRDDELIIIDGLSSDHTSEVVRQNSDIVDVFVSEKDNGPCHAINKGILLAKGKYVKLLTDDDIIYPEAMERVVQILEAHPEVDVIVCGGTRQRGEIISTVWLPSGINYGTSTKDILKYGASGIGFVIRRSAFAITGLFPVSRFVPDKEFILNAVKNGANVKFCRINLYHHQLLDHSVTVKYARENTKYHDHMIKQYVSKQSYYLYRIQRVLRHFALSAIMIKGIDSFRTDGFGVTISRIKRLIFRHRIVPSSPRTIEYWDGGFS